MRHNTALFCGLFLTWICLADPAPLKLFRRITTKEGLSQNTVNAIVEDQYGFMWFGTQDGLCRYDGYDFKTYHHQAGDTSSLSNDYILSLLEDKAGVLWVGTRGGGLNRFNRDLDTFTYWDLTTKGLKKHTASGITCLQEDDKGNLWVGTFEGLIVLDRTRNSVVHMDQEPSKSGHLNNLEVTKILKSRGGSIWVGTQNGLHRWLPNQQRFEVFLNDPSNPSSLSDSHIKSLYEDVSGAIWVGTPKGLNQFDPQSRKNVTFRSEKNRASSLSSNFISSIVQDTSGTIWVATDDAGLNYKKPDSMSWEHIAHDPGNEMSPSAQNLTCLYIDSRNLLWSGTSFDGANVTDLNSKPFFYIGSKASKGRFLSNANVLSILKDSQGILWVGTVKGLNAIRLETNECIQYFHNPQDSKTISGNQVVSIFEDSKGALWFGTARKGLNRFDRVSGEFKRFQHQDSDPNSLSYNGVYSIFEDHEGVLWLGTLGGGLEEFDPSTMTFKHHRTSPNDPSTISVDSIYTIYEDHNKNLLLGMYGGGLNILAPDRTSIRHMRKADSSNSLASDFVMSILEDHLGRLWLGTRSGLHLVDLDTGVLQLWTKGEGLANHVIYSVLEDPLGMLWCSTNHGLCKLDPDTGGVVNYDQVDGLQDNEFNFGAYAIDSEGMMYFGGIGGLSYFNPLDIVDDNTPPLVRLTELLLLNRPVRPAPKSCLQKAISVASQVNLTYSDYVFGFEFAALNFRYPEKSQFKYRLEGFDSDWITGDDKNRHATFTNIPPGDYTFRVQASNQDGFWNTEGASIKVHISPPPWKSWWAYLLYGLLLFSALAAVVQSIRKKMQLKQHELNLEKAFSKELEVKSEQRYRHLFDAIMDAIFICTPEGQFLEVNQGACTQLGYSSSELLNLTFTQIEEPGKGLHIQDHFAAILSNEFDLFEVSLVHKDGSKLIFEVNGYKITWKGRLAIMVICRDITERKRAEDKLQLFNERLTQQVADEVDKRLKNEQILIQQSKLAAMGEMLGAIAHQWRQPLNGLGLIVQNIKDSFDFEELSADELDRYVLRAMDQIDHMSKTIDDFRNFFIPDKEKSEFKVLTVVRNVLNLLSAQLGAKGIQCQVNVNHTIIDVLSEIKSSADEALIAFGYQNELEHVFLNLINNSSNAIMERPESPVDPGLIKVDLSREKSLIVIEVADNGCGIRPEHRNRIFEPYFTTKGSLGTGLGLYMSKVIVEHMDGKLEMGDPSSGALFRLKLPSASV